MKAEGTKENKDDLTDIKGIGPDYERELHQLGILTFTQLAEFKNAQELHRVLEESGSGIQLWKIEKFDWIGQARKKVKKQKILPAIGEKAVSNRGQNQAKFTDPWKEQAAFIVSFDRHITAGDWQTRVYKTENGAEVKFAGTDSSAWTKWIYEEAKIKVVEADVDRGVEAAETELSETELVVAHVPATEVKQLNLVDVQVNRPSTAYGHRGLMVQVHFELLGSEVEIWTEKRSFYRLELFLHDLDKQFTKSVASTQKRMEPGILKYEVNEAIPIPSPGHYKLYVLLFSLPPTEIITTHQGPIINVVPHPVSSI